MHPGDIIQWRTDKSGWIGLTVGGAPEWAGESTLSLKGGTEACAVRQMPDKKPCVAAFGTN